MLSDLANYLVNAHKGTLCHRAWSLVASRFGMLKLPSVVASLVVSFLIGGMVDS